MHPLFLTLSFALVASGDEHIGAPTPNLWWVDFDADGLDDVLALEPDGSGRLLRGVGDGRFEDVSDLLIGQTGGAHMAVWGDVNGDGRLDLYLPSWGKASRLLLQSDAGSFVDAGEPGGLPPRLDPLDATFRDIDGDGDLDLHLVTEVDDLVYRNDGLGHFDRLDLGLTPRGVRSGATDVDAARAARGLPPIGEGDTTTNGPGAPGYGFEVVCALGVQDQANPGNCISASSVPTLGMLYPISSALYVDAATGNVGVGTTTPNAPFEVNGYLRASGNIRGAQGVFSSDPPLAVVGTSVVNNLNADLLDGLDASSFATLPVTGGMIADGSIGSADLGANSVGASQIAAGAVGSSEVADNSLTSADLGAGSVGGSEIADGAITDADISGSANISGSKINPVFGPALVTTGKTWIGDNVFGLNMGSIMTHHADGTREGYVGPLSTTLYTIGVHDNSSVFIQGGVYHDDSTDTSTVFGNVKSFREPNPADPDTEIVYACVEGPEAAMYVRGTAQLVNGAAHVELPAHFRTLASENGLTVQLTPRSADSRGLAVIERSTASFEVQELLRGTGTYEFDWEVKAVRARYETWEVVQPRLRVPAVAAQQK